MLELPCSSADSAHDVVLTAFLTSSAPEPDQRIEYGLILLVEAVPTMAPLTCCGDQDGLACRISAAAPATCGEAIEVPLSSLAPDTLLPSVELTSTPGAETSGFRMLLLRDGPAELKSAME